MMHELVVLEGDKKIALKLGPTPHPSPPFVAGQFIAWPSNNKMRVTHVMTVFSSPQGHDLITSVLAVDDGSQALAGGEVPFPFFLPDDLL